MRITANSAIDKLLNNNFIKKVCAFCSREFLTTNDRAKYCCDSHKVQASRNGLTNKSDTSIPEVPQFIPKAANRDLSWITEANNYFNKFKK